MLTKDEALVLERIKRRPLVTIVRGIDWAGARPEVTAHTDGLHIITANLRDMERRGYLDAWTHTKGQTRWTATDQLPSFERPHWRCEVFDEGPLRVISVFVTVDPDHPEAICQRATSIKAWGETCERALADCIEHAQELIAEAIALRSSGQPCECGGCDA